MPVPPKSGNKLRTEYSKHPALLLVILRRVILQGHLERCWR